MRKGEFAILKERHIAFKKERKKKTISLFYEQEKKDENCLQFKAGSEFRTLEVRNCLLWFDPSANEYHSAEGTGALENAAFF